MTFTFIGVRADGTRITLPEPAEVTFDSTDDAPADGFQGIFPLMGEVGVLARLEIKGDGETLFLGTVDVQREIVSGSGNALRLTCRSLAGLLLDSEAVPQTYVYPSLGTVFTRHIGPYGFTSFLGSMSAFREPLRVVKGMSEWQAAAEFCETFLRVTPRVHGTVFDASGAAQSGSLELDNLRGTQYFRAEVRNRRCDLLSAVYAPDGITGAYRLVAEDTQAKVTGIRRSRCLTGTSLNAEAMLKKAERSAFAVYVDCPGAPQAFVGAAASLNDPVFGVFGGLKVSRVRCVFDAGGLRTSYCLRRD